MAIGYLFVVENAGRDFSFLHILRTDEQGLQVKTAQTKIRLRGQVLTPPIVAKDKVLVVTDRRRDRSVRGDARQRDVDAGHDDRAAECDFRNTDHQLFADGRRLHVGGEQPAGEVPGTELRWKIPSEWVLDEGDVFLAPLQLLGDVIVHVRRRQNSPGLTVAAIRVSEKDPVWQTEIAVPARVCLRKGKVRTRSRLAVVVLRSTPQDFERGVMVAAQSSAVTDERLTLSLAEAADVGNGEWSFGSAPDYNQEVFFRPGEYGHPVAIGDVGGPGWRCNPTAHPVQWRTARATERWHGGLHGPTSAAGSACRPFIRPFRPVRARHGIRPAIIDGGQEFIIANRVACCIVWACKSVRSWRNLGPAVGGPTGGAAGRRRCRVLRDVAQRGGGHDCRPDLRHARDGAAMAADRSAAMGTTASG